MKALEVDYYIIGIFFHKIPEKFFPDYLTFAHQLDYHSLKERIQIKQMGFITLEKQLEN